MVRKIADLVLTTIGDKRIRTINDLKESLSALKIVELYYSGKLLKWLGERRYMSEYDAVANLSADDANLCNKLCSIFGLPAIDDEEKVLAIAKKLQPFISNRDIELKDIDSVAFNQEELGKLYEKDLSIIYLANNEFIVDRSKVVEYKLLGSASIVNKEIDFTMNENKLSFLNKLPNSCEEYKRERKKNFEIPDQIAQKILGCYVLTENYLLYEFGNRLFSYNINTKHEEEIEYRFSPLGVNLYYLHADQVIIKNRAEGESIMFGNTNKITLYDCDTNSYDVINHKCKHDIAVHGRLLAYYDENGNINLYDCKKKVLVKTISVVKLRMKKENDEKYTKLKFLDENTIVYGNAEILLKLDINTYKKNILYSVPDRLIISSFFKKENSIYILLCKRFLGDYFKIAEVNTLTGEKKVHLEKNEKVVFSSYLDIEFPYICYVCKRMGFPLYMFNCITNELVLVSKNCGYYLKEEHIFRDTDYYYYENSFRVIGDFLYFEKGESKEKCKICLKDY